MGYKKNTVHKMIELLENFRMFSINLYNYREVIINL